MLSLFTPTWHLYRGAFYATGRSLVRGWVVILAVIVFTMLMLLSHTLARPLGMAGGLSVGRGECVTDRRHSQPG